MSGLFAAAGDFTVAPEHVAAILARDHYLGPRASAQFAWSDEFGVMVFANPAAATLPQDWLELSRWCLIAQPNAGSQQWARFAAYARRQLKASTIVSYSDPAQGHTGALYRACGWLWAPTWRRLRPPPSGNSSWSKAFRRFGTGDPEMASVKDRWVYPLAPDPRRQAVLALKDAALERRFPWTEYREPSWRRGRFDAASGGGDYKRWINEGATP